jgi:hypothetical protein
LLDNPVAHPTVLMRKALVEKAGLYDPCFELAEDYELWTRMIEFTRFANLPEALVRYRMHAESTVSHSAVNQRERVLKARQRFLSGFLAQKVSLETLRWYRHPHWDSDRPNGSTRMDLDQIESFVRLTQQLHQTYLKRNSLNRALRRKISRDVGDKLHALAASIRSVSLITGIGLYLQAIPFKPGLLSPPVLIKGMRNLMNSLTRCALRRSSSF